MRAKPEKALREAARRKGFPPPSGCGPKNQHDLTSATAVYIALLCGPAESDRSNGRA